MASGDYLVPGLLVSSGCQQSHGHLEAALPAGVNEALGTRLYKGRGGNVGGPNGFIHRSIFVVVEVFVIGYQCNGRQSSLYTLSWPQHKAW